MSNGRIGSIKSSSASGLAHDGEGDVAEVDLSGCTILPGLIDAHVHLAMSGSEDAAVRHAQLSSGYEHSRRKIAERLQRHLARGVVAVRDGGDWQGHGLRFKRGQPVGDNKTVQILASGRAWNQSGRYGRFIGRSVAGGMTLAQAIAADNDAIDQVKVINSGINSLTSFGRETPPQFGREELARGMMAAERKGLGVMVHANGHVPVEFAVAGGCRSIEHGYFMGEDNLRRMADNQVTWVPTAVPMSACRRFYKKDTPEGSVARKTLDHQLEQIAAAKMMGVPVAMGTDAGSLGVHHGRSALQEMRLFICAGYSLEAAVRCTTVNGARLLGLEGLGRLTPGRRATFVAVEGTPAQLPESLERIVCVYLDGHLADG